MNLAVGWLGAKGGFLQDGLSSCNELVSTCRVCRGWDETDILSSGRLSKKADKFSTHGRPGDLDHPCAFGNPARQAQVA